MIGSDLGTRRLPVQHCESGRPGPIVWLTGCMHGDEVGGIVVIQEVFRRVTADSTFRGSLHAFPLLNPLGFESGSRTVTPSREDLNRSFPGDPRGSLAQRMAGLVFETIRESGADLVLDLHNDWRRSIPYAVLDPTEAPSPAAAAARRAASASGLLVVSEDAEQHRTRGLDHSLSGSLIAHGTPAVTLELGESFVVNERNVAVGTGAILRVLADAGSIDPPPDAAPFFDPPPGSPTVFDYTERPLASQSGLVRFRKQPGATVEPGAIIARIEDAFGRHRETLRAECSGVVLGSDDSSVSYPGKPVMAFAARPGSPTTEREEGGGSAERAGALPR